MRWRLRLLVIKIQAVLNGVLITNFNNNSILTDSAHEKYNVGQSGHIALQIHTGDQLKNPVFKISWSKRIIK